MSIRPSPNSELGTRFPGLRELSLSYVTVSWDYEFGSPEAAVAAFCEDQPGLTACAAEGIDALFREYPDEAARAAALAELDWGFVGRPGVLDIFLAWARDALSTAASGTTLLDGSRAG